MVRRRALISKYNLTAFMGLSYFRLSHIRKRTPHTNILVRVTYAASEIISDPDLYDVASTHFFSYGKTHHIRRRRNFREIRYSDCLYVRYVGSGVFYAASANCSRMNEH